MQPEIFYLDPNPTGSPTVVFIHGLGADAESWWFQLRALAEIGMRPIAMDMPGFGKTAMIDDRWNLQKATDDLVEWLAGISPGKSCLVGLSMGGVIAQKIAFEHPELVEKLVLVSSFSNLRPKSLRSWKYLLTRVLTAMMVGPEAQAERVARHLFPDTSQEIFRQMIVEKIKQADPRAYKGAMRSLAIFDSRKRLEKLNLPVLVITGDRDGTVPPENQTDMAHRIPGAKQVIIKDAGHAVIVEQVEQFNQHLVAFLTQAAG